MNVPVMPNEYRGISLVKGKYTKTTPQKWTSQEIEWVKKLKDDGYSISEIAESTGRSEISVQIKFKRLGKKNNTYNSRHILEKYEINNNFLQEINPETVLDVYTGEKDFYQNYKRITNDKNNNIKADYHMDAHKFMCIMFCQDKKFDFIDLDPFGSAYDCFDLAIKMAKKGIAITLGELGHKRWKRFDFVSSRYDINKIEDFTIENIVSYIQKIGIRNKKRLIIYDFKEWRNIGRVWFKIEPLKTTSQWNNKEEKMVSLKENKKVAIQDMFF